MTAVLTGIYKEGKIELSEIPKGLRSGRVRVVVTEEEDVWPERQYLEFGKYKGEIETALQDFEGAEWHGETEFDELYSE